ncbi:MAG TPA: PIG-L family deacetylase [Acidimicrobiia bacterium]|nr:PIG-L family deacetylase [Acidimicrobiia bacterium]
MPGLLAFHAHPDDEVIGTGGVLARYAAAGEQVVVVTATDGAEGEIHNYEDPEALREQLVELRAEEVRAALDILGVKHHEFLGFRDSGMMGTNANSNPTSFWQADLFEAAHRLVRLIRRYQPEVMTIYDPFGGYGHPDHIQVHRIGMAAFFGCRDLGWFPLEAGEEEWRPQKLYWSAWGRERMGALNRMRAEANPDGDSYLTRADRGFPDEELSAEIDVSEYVDLKLAALRAHRSQIPDDWFALTVPEEDRRAWFGRETFLRLFSAVPTPHPESDLFAGLR